MSISRGWGPGLVTASWLNRRVMNGPGAWLRNGLQMPGILLQTCQNSQLISCIGKHEKKKKKVDRWKKERERETWVPVWNRRSLTQHWRLLLAWPSALIKNPSQSALKITFSSHVCTFLHRSTSQSNLPGYHNSHSVPRPQTPPTPLPLSSPGLLSE